MAEGSGTGVASDAIGVVTGAASGVGATAAPASGVAVAVGTGATAGAAPLRPKRPCARRKKKPPTTIPARTSPPAAAPAIAAGLCCEEVVEVLPPVLVIRRDAETSAGGPPDAGTWVPVSPRGEVPAGICIVGVATAAADAASFRARPTLLSVSPDVETRGAIPMTARRSSASSTASP